VSKSGPEGKSFQIPKQLVWEAYRRVKANKGAAGVDGQSMAGGPASPADAAMICWWAGVTEVRVSAAGSGCPLGGQARTVPQAPS
jgi:hypothetical protein